MKKTDYGEGKLQKKTRRRIEGDRERKRRKRNNRKERRGNKEEERN
jgi:hypothetical protein